MFTGLGGFVGGGPSLALGPRSHAQVKRDLGRRRARAVVDQDAAVVGAPFRAVQERPHDDEEEPCHAGQGDETYGVRPHVATLASRVARALPRVSWTHALRSGPFRGPQPPPRRPSAG